jgi:hypothetical protein
MVQYKAFKIGLAETSSERLNSFLRQNTVVCVDKRFVEAGQESFYAVLVEYDMQIPDSKYDKKEKIDYAKILDKKQFACFNEIREYRNKAAKEDGVTSGNPVLPGVFAFKRLELLAGEAGNLRDEIPVTALF